ncbi:MAG TPA: glycosyltransferase [Chloroflexota bacterium]|nr:glycosyltransferase [Chloroflexota bacterium]
MNRSRATWPLGLPVAEDAPVGIVVVNYNTRNLIAQLVYSLYRQIRRPRFQLVVVDNASSDGSAELLEELSAAGLCVALLNSEQRYHGPGLNQGFDYLAARQSLVAEENRLRFLWVLDSDCVVIRPDALSAAVDVMHITRAGLVGQWEFDEWHQGDMMGLHSLLVDPLLVWQDEIEPFQEHGNPSEALQICAARAGILTAEFPFTRDGYVIHLGRGTLRSVAQNNERSNQYFTWATAHNRPHFMLEKEGPARYERFLAEFRADVGDVTAESLIRACAHYHSEDPAP